MLVSGIGCYVAHSDVATTVNSSRYRQLLLVLPYQVAYC